MVEIRDTKKAVHCEIAISVGHFSAREFNCNMFGEGVEEGAEA
jgi:hypothetical protein